MPNGTPAVFAYLGLGSNLPHGEQAGSALLSTALDVLNRHPQICVRYVSSFYATSPVVNDSKDTVPEYCNAATCIETTLSAEHLLGVLQGIELSHGRTRDLHQRWQARTLDLDILLYADARIDLPYLTVPHPELPNRGFVLHPLQDIQSQMNQTLHVPDAGELNDVLDRFLARNQNAQHPQTCHRLSDTYIFEHN